MEEPISRTTNNSSSSSSKADDHRDQTPPLDRLDDPPLTDDDFRAEERENETEKEEEVVETLKDDDDDDGDKETAKEVVVKDGWSDDGYGNATSSFTTTNTNNLDHKQVDDGWNDAERSPAEPRYPLRPGADDCNFYMRMGTCKFGFSCKFNHPPDRTKTTTAPTANNQPRMKEREDTSERPIQTECKYYLSAGGCKYGKACRFNHSREKTSVVPVLEYNFLGLPIRLGEKDCPFYMRSGACKYGANCRFTHPDPTTGSDSPSVCANGEQAPSWSPSRPVNEAAPFIPVSYSLARGAHSQLSKWNQGPIFTQEKNFRPSPAFGSNIHPVAQSSTSHFQPQLASEEFPERPGQPECTYFIKTGDCKFRSGCKFHHPKDRTVQPSCAMTEKGLPLRPGQSICTHYSNYGICKFGPKCRYDHPPNIQHMAPSIMTGLDRPQHPSTNFASPGDTSRLSSLGEGTVTL